MTTNISGSSTPGLAVLLGLALLLAPAAIAQEAAESQEPGAGQTAEEPAAEAEGAEPAPAFIAEIVVTAQKREETLLEVPLSVTAFTADMISDNLITNLQEISIRTPGMNYGNFGDQKLSPLSLRGVFGDTSTAGADPAVSQYVDEVYIGAGAGAFIDLFDIQRAEVLRGPQGVFFGRNSIGGALSYTTKRPANEFEALFEGTYGDYNYHRLGALVGGPLVKDKLAGKVTFTSNGRDGTFQNLWLDRDVNTQGSWSARGQLLWNPADATQLTLTGEHSEIDQESLHYETLKYNDEQLFVQLIDAFGLPRNEDPYDRDLYGDIEQPETLEMSGYSLHITAPIGDVGLTSITSYRDHEYSSIRDTDATGLRWLYDGDPEQVDRFSQEIRVAWATAKTSLLFGVYYYDQTSNNQSFVNLGVDATEILIGMPMEIGAGSDATLSTTSYAGFANLTFTLSDRADLSAGLRYTRDEKEIDYSQEDPLELFGGTFTLQAKDDWGAPTPAFNFRYAFSDDLRGYANVSRGFKSGGFNDGLGSGDGISFDPEFLWNYEIGLKSRLADGRVTANIALFYMDWSDIQIVADNPDTPNFDPITANAGAAHSTGIEGEIMALPSRHWTLGMNFSVLEAKYDGGTDLEGNPLDRIPYSPDYTVNLSAEYRGGLSGRTNWFVGGGILSRGELYLTDDNQEDGRVGPYNLVDARLGIEGTDGRWRVTVWGKNVFDKAVKQRLIDMYDLFLIGQKFIALNDPATYGVTLRFAF